MYFPDQMNLFKGLSGKFLIPYFLTLLFGVWTYVSIRDILHLEDLQRAVLWLKIEVLDLRKDEKDFLTRAVKSPEFMTTGHSEYLVNHRKTAAELADKLRALRGDALSDKELSEVLDLLKRYTSTFDTLAATIRTRGFKDDGLEGKLRQAIHEVENADLSYDHSYMLMLRRHEKDFFLRGDLAYVRKFEEAVEPFRRHILQMTREPGQRARILALIDQYHRLFMEVVQMDQQIGLDENSGLLGELRMAIHELTPFLDELVMRGNRRIEAKIFQNVWVLIVLFVVIVAVGIFILRNHINKITRNINLINQTAVTLSRGEFVEVHQVLSKDELGEAHEALNRLNKGLQEKTRFAGEIRVGQLKTNLESLGENDQLGVSLLDMRDNLATVTREMNKAIRKASEEGNLQVRVNTELRQGAWLKLSNSINTLMESVSRPLEQINAIAGALAAGDLTMSYADEAHGDVLEMAQNLNRGLTRIQGMLMAILTSALEIRMSSEEMLILSTEMDNSTAEVATAIGQMSLGSQRQQARVDEAAQLIESILKLANGAVAMSQEINSSAEQGIVNSQQGQKLIAQLHRDMETVASSSQSTKSSIHSLVEYSVKINQILGVMNDISRQTNLLALNAAIEAAQAGESGRGFAVVAEEIRKLAESSKKSSAEIELLIREIQQETTTSERMIDEMDRKVKNGRQVTQQAAETFDRNARLTEQILELSQRILQSAGRQEMDLQEMVQVTEAIVIIAEQSASTAEEVASSASELSGGMRNFRDKSERLTRIAQSLQEEVDTFKLKDSSALES